MKMPRHATPMKAILLGMAFILSACVTINIYFPAAAAEAAAEKIVEDVLGSPATRKPESDKTPSQPAGDKEGRVPMAQPFGLALLDLLVPPAHAAPDFDVDTPAIRQIQARMKARNSELQPFYAAGAAGFGNDGLVAVKDSGAVAVRDRARLNKLLAAENKDRNALYKEIAKANQHPEWEPEVRAVFAKKWVQNAGKGWWVQDPSGGWRQK